jgi:hypothetical protein
MKKTFEKRKVLKVVEDRISPLIGETMAQASTLVHCQKLGIVKDEISADEVESLLGRIGQAMLVFVGKEKTERILEDIHASLGTGGKTP